MSGVQPGLMRAPINSSGTGLILTYHQTARKGRAMKTKTQMLDSLISGLPETYRVIHKGSQIAIWTDGVHHGGALTIPESPVAKSIANSVAMPYGLGLLEVWKDVEHGFMLLTFGTLEG